MCRGFQIAMFYYQKVYVFTQSCTDIELWPTIPVISCKSVMKNKPFMECIAPIDNHKNLWAGTSLCWRSNPHVL